MGKPKSVPELVEKFSKEWQSIKASYKELDRISTELTNLRKMSWEESGESVAVFGTASHEIESRRRYLDNYIANSVFIFLDWLDTLSESGQ